MLAPAPWATVSRVTYGRNAHPPTSGLTTLHQGLTCHSSSWPPIRQGTGNRKRGHTAQAVAIPGAQTVGQGM